MSFRSALDQLLTIVGVILIVVPVALTSESWTPLIVVFIGIAMIALGVWGLGTRIFSERRVYVRLRSEVDDFIKLVSRLNTHALSGESELIDEIRAQMKDAVDRMVMHAGRSTGNS
ncbi:MAG: hypothetical protein AMS21_02305 [Gemmatimonas sp. SG8_38_2]|nr:MAG: hypothetical protein AMS21_02305 [Gemmatimonas sp. SG8_38_2]